MIHTSDWIILPKQGLGNTIMSATDLGTHDGIARATNAILRERDKGIHHRNSDNTSEVGPAAQQKDE